MTIDVQNLVKTFDGRAVLSIPSLQVGAGEVFGLVGSNGAGKTTFLRLLLDLLPATGGRVIIDDLDVRTNTTWKSATGSFLDESFLIDYLTADEYLQFIARVYNVPSDEYLSLLRPFQSFFTDELFGETTKFIRELSRGNAKKLGLTGAMFFGPRLLVLDEPFATLDPRSQIRLKQLITDLNRKFGTTIVVSSHDLLHVTEICDRIAILENGVIAQDMPRTEATLEALREYFASERMMPMTDDE